MKTSHAKPLCLYRELEILKGISEQRGLALATVREILGRNQTEPVVGIK